MSVGVTGIGRSPRAAGRYPLAALRGPLSLFATGRSPLSAVRSPRSAVRCLAHDRWGLVRHVCRSSHERNEPRTDDSDYRLWLPTL